MIRLQIFAHPVEQLVTYCGTFLYDVEFNSNVRFWPEIYNAMIKEVLVN